MFHTNDDHRLTFPQLSRSNPVHLRVIVVSLDGSLEGYSKSTSNKAYLALEFGDGSGYLDSSAAVVEELLRGEEFLSGEDVDRESSLVEADPWGEVYVRPYSRAKLASHFGVSATPTMIA